MTNAHTKNACLFCGAICYGPLLLSDAIWRQRIVPSLVQVMACPLHDAMPLPGPILTYFQYDPQHQTSSTFESKYNHPHSRNTFDNIDGLVQERLNSIANAQELRLFCTNPSISSVKCWPFCSGFTGLNNGMDPAHGLILQRNAQNVITSY